MIIYGTRGVTSNHKQGQFYCPTCGPDASYAHKRVRRFFTLYFIPIIPLDLLGEYVECRGCAQTYKPGVLDLDPAGDKAAFEAEFHTAVRRVMVKMMLADGAIEDDEVTAIADIYQKLANKTLAADQIRAEAAALATDTQSIKQYVAGIRGQLNDKGKELVVRAAMAVASADGAVSDEEKLLLLQIGEAMEMTQAHLMGVLQVAADA